MRLLALQLVALALVGCSSSPGGTLPDRTQCEDTFERVWAAAGYAVHELGFEIVHFDPENGLIHGRIDTEVFGSAIEIDVAVLKSGGGRMRSTPSIRWLEYRIVNVDNPDPDKYQREQLEILRKRFLEIVMERAGCAGSY